MSRGTGLKDLNKQRLIHVLSVLDSLTCKSKQLVFEPDIEELKSETNETIRMFCEDARKGLFENVKFLRNKTPMDIRELSWGFMSCMSINEYKRLFKLIYSKK